ncbi:TonB-dependent receptor [Compostibacter hankyongensis]|uniref:TonB-dependent receptor n=1 Tax=Compostibacter hankyongensis TaxID=1007089 RepID=A0ABP8G8T7_9BACT
MVLLLLPVAAFAQFRVTGTVTSADNSAPLPGVTIRVKGTTTGTASDASGKYALEVPDGNTATLVFSFTGYEEKEVPVANQHTVNLTMSMSSTQLNEFVAIGYGTVKKSDVTGAIGTINSEKLMDRPSVPNVSQALEGKLPGVDVNVNSNAPGQAAKIRIRGIASISSNLDPLFVVDGVVGVPPNTINPNDIESIQVLKDASSEAIYGARGSNGIIMVTTKRGKAGPPTISYEGNVNVSTLSRHLKTLNSEQFIDVYNEAYKNGQKFDPLGEVQTPPKALNHENFPLLFDENDNPLYNTNWESETYKPAVSTNHYLILQGGNDKSLYSLSLGFQDQNGLMIESWYKRYSVRFTMDNDINSWLKIGGDIAFNKDKQRMVSDANGGLNVPRMVTEEVPILPVKYPDGIWAGNFDIDGLEGGPNPVDIAHNRYGLNNTQQTLGSVYLLFHLTKDLDFKTDFGYGVASNKSNFYSSMNLQHLSADQGGVATSSSGQAYYWQSESYLTWNKQISEQQRLTALLGVSWLENYSESVNAEGQDFVDDFFQWHNLNAGAVKQAIGTSDGKRTMNSYYARLMYNIAEKYMVTATGRYDGSSVFGENNKYAFFPSIGAAWRISSEDFLKDNKTISDLKLRASYGAAGNQEIGNYRSLATIIAGNTVLGGENQSILVPDRLGNPDLKWEKSIQADVGIELGLFENRVSLEADYYNKRTKNLLLQAPIPWSAGMGTPYVYKNVGSVRNAGIEISLSTTNIQTKNVTWTTDFAFASNKNTILKLNEGNADIFPGPNFLGETNVLRVGYPIGSFYGMTRLGTYGSDEAAEADEHGLKPGDRKYIYNEDGSPYYSIIGRAYPKWTGVFSTKLTVKNWDLSANIRFVQGVNTAATFKHSSEDRQTIANSLTTVLDGWTEDHQNTMISQVRNYKFAQDSHFDTWWVEDGSFIRGQNFVLGYTFPESTLSKMKMSKLRFYVSVDNLFIITKYTGYDPEVDTYMTGYGDSPAFSQNLDFFPYPRPRVWTLGASVKF